MGRRARTNCSPIDSAMEKYHNDIGSRLSGVFIPPPPQPGVDNNGTEIAPNDTLNHMFTLDMRSKNHQNRHKNSNQINHNNNRSHHHNTDVPNSKEINSSSSQLSQPQSSATTTASSHNPNDVTKGDDDNISNYNHCQCPSSSRQKSPEKSQTLPASFGNQAPHFAVDPKVPESYSCAEDGRVEKRGLVDKLTRALFQRKHTCTRCQRKSRSCLPNKNFNSPEKHYTCGRCREMSHTMKTLVSGHHSIHTNNRIDLTKSDALTLTTSESSTGVVVLKPRTGLKDSGYDTATSCSTVASSNSHHSTHKSRAQNYRPEEFIQRGRQNNGGDYEEPSPYVEHCIAQSSSCFNHSTTCGTHECSWVQNSQCPNSHAAPTQPPTTTATLQQYMGVAGDNSSIPVLKQVKNRYVENYDGYLDHANTQQLQHTCLVKRPAHTQECVNSNAQCCASNYPCTMVNDNDTDSSSVFNSQVHQQCAAGVYPGVCCSSTKPEKSCYTCGSSSKPCFRLPWAGGWLCEDCLDGVF